MATTHLVCDLSTTQPHNALRDRSLCPITSLDAPLVFVSLPCGAPESRSAIGSWRNSDFAPSKRCFLVRESASRSSAGLVGPVDHALTTRLLIQPERPARGGSHMHLADVAKAWFAGGWMSRPGCADPPCLIDIRREYSAFVLTALLSSSQSSVVL